jgi:hypothetical protein
MLVRFVTLLAVVVLGAASAEAQTQVRQYAAKFVCGKASDVEGALYLAALGTYYTAINVHNPLRTLGVKFQKKFAPGQPGEKPGKVTVFFPTGLGADETMQIDCGDIYKHTGISPGTFLEGFAVLEITPVQRELDVVSVITAAPPGGGVSTLHTERVPSRLTQ